VNSVDVELEDLLAAGDRQYKEELEYKDFDPDPPDYNKRIPVAIDIDSNEVVEISLDATKRLGMFGPSGSGKTTLAKALISRARKGGWKAFHGSDVKNDFKSFNRKGGASKKLQEETEGLLPGEEPEAMDRVLAIPHFMASNYSSRPQYGTIFSLALSDLSNAEFKFLSGFHNWKSSAAQESLDEMLMNIDIENAGFEYMIDVAETEYDGNTLGRKLNGLKNKNLLTDRVNYTMRDVLGMFQEKETFSLGLKKWRDFLNGQEHFFQFYCAKAIRSLKDMIDQGEVDGDIITFFDEFHKLAPQGKESMVKDEFQDFYDLSARQRGIATIIASQRPTQLPNPDNLDDLDFISDLTDVFLMRGRTPLNEAQWKMIVRSMGVYDGGGGKQLKAWRRKMQSLNRFEGVYINSEKHHTVNDCPRIRTLSPLVAHPG